MKLQYSKILSLCLLVTLFWGNKADAGFMNGTLVAVPDQYGEVLLVPIEKLEVGDVILGEDPVEGIVPVIIKRIEERPIKYFIHISISPNRYFSCNRYISSTEDQLYCEYRDKGNNQWKEIAAINLKKGDILSASSLGKHVNAKVVNIRETSWLFFHSNPCAYFLDVDRTHNFFVSDFEQRFDYKAMTFHSNEKLLYAQTMKLNITDIGIQNFEAVSKKLCSVLHTRGKDHMTLLVHNAIPAYIAQVGSIFETTEFLKAEGEAVGSCVGNMAVGLAVILSNLDGKSAEFINLSKISGEVDQNNIHDDYIQAEYNHIKREEQKQLKAEYNSHSNVSIHGSGGGMTEVKSHRKPKQDIPTHEEQMKTEKEQQRLCSKYKSASIYMDNPDFGIIEINGEYCPQQNGVVLYKGKYIKADIAKRSHEIDKRYNDKKDRTYGRKEGIFGNHTKPADKIIRDNRIKEKTEREAAIKQYIEEKMRENPADVDRIARSINDGTYRNNNNNLDQTYTSNTDEIGNADRKFIIENAYENIKEDDEDVLYCGDGFTISKEKRKNLPGPVNNRPPSYLGDDESPTSTCVSDFVAQLEPTVGVIVTAGLNIPKPYNYVVGGLIDSTGINDVIKDTINDISDYVDERKQADREWDERKERLNQESKHRISEVENKKYIEDQIKMKNSYNKKIEREERRRVDREREVRVNNYSEKLMQCDQSFRDKYKAKLYERMKELKKM